MSDYFINQPSNEIPTGSTTELLRTSRSLAYHAALPFYQSAPLVSLPHLAQSLGVGQIYVKDEAFRFGLNAFKGLGVSYAVHQLLESRPELATFCTATDGNHGRAVAWAARLANKKSQVFVPQDTTAHRIAAIEREGGTVTRVSGNYDQACAAAELASRQVGWQLVQDTAWSGYEEIPGQIMAGYLTHFQELETTLHPLPSPKVDLVFLQAGVGSWAGAAVWYYLHRYGRQRPKLVIVEPSEAAGILASFRAGRRVSPVGSYQTIMAGLNCGIPSLIGWDILQNGTDATLGIGDEYAKQAMRALFYPTGTDARVVAGESGAAGLAGLLALLTEPKLLALKAELQLSEKSAVLLFNTEGATDPDRFAQIVGTGHRGQ